MFKIAFTREVSFVSAIPTTALSGAGITGYAGSMGTNSNNKFYSNSVIKIFDRYGKFIKQFTAAEDGWDGLYNGILSPADDYWYNIQFDDGRTAKGHFSLKR